MYFDTKSYLKSNRYHIAKHAFKKFLLIEYIYIYITWVLILVCIIINFTGFKMNNYINFY